MGCEVERWIPVLPAGRRPQERPIGERVGAFLRVECVEVAAVRDSDRAAADPPEPVERRGAVLHSGILGKGKALRLVAAGLAHQMDMCGRKTLQRQCSIQSGLAGHLLSEPADQEEPCWGAGYVVASVVQRTLRTMFVPALVARRAPLEIGCRAGGTRPCVVPCLGAKVAPDGAAVDKQRRGPLGADKGGGILLVFKAHQRHALGQSLQDDGGRVLLPVRFSRTRRT